MITVKIQIKEHLAEYMYGKYCNGDTESPVKLSTMDDLYHLKWNLLRKRPKNHTPVDTGNLCFELNAYHEGKNPETYNYLDHLSTKIIESKIEALFFLELHTRVDENRQDGYPMTTQQIIHMFMCEYCIDSISEDALQKNIYRHNQKVARRKKKRNYTRKD